MKLGERLKTIYYCISMFILLILLSYMLFGVDVDLNYEEEGIRTQAIITGSSGRTYYGVYEDEQGNRIEAEIIPNKTVIMGEEVEGYYMADKPEVVWCKPSDSLNVLFKAILWFMWIICFAGCALLILAFVAIKKKEREKNKAIWEEGMRGFYEEDIRSEK